MNIFFSKKTLNNNLACPCLDANSTSKTVGENLLFINNENEVTGFNIKIDSNKEIAEGRLFPTKELVELIKNELKQDIKITTKGFMVGEIIEAEKIPDTHLSKCKVDIGDETLDIVCGANNARKGIFVVVATIGVIMPSGLFIRPSKLKGFASNGMLCSQKELNLMGFNESGIIELDKTYKKGDVFKQMYKNL